MVSQESGFRSLLQQGAWNEIGQASEVAAQVLELPDLLPILLACLEDEDKGVRSRTAHAMMQVANENTSLFQSHVELLINKMGNSPQWELQEQYSKIIIKLELDGEQAQKVAEQFIGILLGKSAIARACGLQGLHDLAKRDLIEVKIYQKQLELALKSPSKALSARARKLAAN